VTGGAVSTVGFVAYVQPISFIQNGLVVTTDYVASSAIPASLTAPYSIGFSVSSAVENLSEVLTPIFVKRPQDVSANTVLVADWDGSEWISRPKLQIKEQIAADQLRAVKQEFSGITDGLDVSIDGSNTVVSSGALIDRQGGMVVKTTSTTLANAGDDPDGLGRIDTVVYRRPDDSTSRVGYINQVVGRVFNATDTLEFLHGTQLGDSAKQNSATKIIHNASDGSNHVFYVEDVGARTKLRLRTMLEDGSLAGAHVGVVDDLLSYDAILNPEGSLDLVYVRGNNLYYKRVTTAGVDVYAEHLVATHVVALSNPRLVSIRSGATYFLHVVYEVATSIADHKLYYLRLSASNSIETQPVSLVSLSALATNPSLDKDDDDSVLYLAFENFTTHRAYLRTYDASTATYLSAPVSLSAAIELQDDTYSISGDVVLPNTGAYNPIVKRSATKDTYVFWLHNKGGAFGVAVYNPQYLADFGHKAVLQDLVISSEDIGLFSVTIDGMNGAHYLFSYNSEVYRASLDLMTMNKVIDAASIDAAGAPSSASIAFSRLGSANVAYTFASAGFGNNGVPRDIHFMGAGLFDGVPINSNEFVVYKDDFLPAYGYSTLPVVPAVGDKIVVSGTSSGNDGTHDWASVRYITAFASDYAVVGTNSVFSNVMSGLAQFETPLGSGIYAGKTTCSESANLRSFSVPRTDIYIAFRRTPDDVLAVSGTSLEETSTIRRLYEFFNTFAGGGGTVSWSKVGANKLALSSALILRVFNRTATYTIDAIPAGITINANQIAYIELPDEDTDATLTLKVLNFGAGILDRYGRKAFPLFWNMGGYLYMRFSPFRLESSGETIQIGAQISDELIEWLGSVTENPDPDNHGYTSTTGCGLAQSDNLIEAISKIDSTVLTLTGSLNKINAHSVAIADTSTSVKYTFSTPKSDTAYLVSASMANYLDANPQYQPLVITKKELDGVTFSWNNPADSANYSIEFFIKES
jgi:hypothetical protein